jgi:tRNA threonylcarbamoyladenosine biosynthesis protein TsaE
MTDHRRDHESTLVRRSGSADQTRAIGEALGTLLTEGDVVLLQGDLGAGKTTLTQGVARGAGSEELVNSPTFILVNEYRGRIKLYHADLYRLDDPDEVLALDLPGASLDGALVVEWPERGEGLLPVEHLLVRILHRSPDERTLEFVPRGRRARILVERLAAAIDEKLPARDRVGGCPGTDD